MKKAISRLFVLLLIIVFSCGKSNNDPSSNNDQSSNDGKLSRIVDTLTLDTTNFYYNELQQVKALQYISRSYSSYIDTFMYERNNLKFSQYNLGTTLTTKPYARTEYTYRINLPVSSNYIYNNNVTAHCEFFYDNAGRLDSIDQTSYNPFSGITGKTFAFKYDDNSNLTEIYQAFKDYDTRQYLVASLSNYDKHPNPVYKFPWIFDVDFYQFSYEKLSKNNCGKIVMYLPRPDTTVDRIKTYTFKYDAQGKVLTRKTVTTAGTYEMLSFEVYYYSAVK